MTIFSNDHSFMDFEIVPRPLFEDVRYNVKQRVKDKIPRNSKCTCGSGVKYKKCCGKI